MYWLAGYWPPYVTIVARGDHGGYMARSAAELERRASQTRDELLAAIRVSLGGRAAEQLMYGSDAGLTTGASADLEQATRVARQMVCRHGMDDQFGLLVTPELLKYEAALSSPMYVQVNQAASKILQAEMERTRQLLEQNRQHLETVTVALAANERLTADDLQQLLPQNPATAGDIGSTTCGT